MFRRCSALVLAGTVVVAVACGVDGSSALAPTPTDGGGGRLPDGAPVPSTGGTSTGPGAAPGSGDDDGGADADAAEGVDAGPSCDPAKPFGAPSPISELNTKADEAAPRLTRDERTIYFDRGPVGTRDIYVARRASLADTFGDPVPVRGVNSSGDEADPAVSADGKTLFLVSTAGLQPGRFGIFSTEELDDGGNFTKPVLVAALSAATGYAVRPFPRADGAELWFSRLDTDKILHMAWPTGDAGGPVVEAELTSAFGPVLSSDARTIYFEKAGGRGGIFVATRNTPDAAFGNVAPVTELGDAGNPFAGWVSPDGCRIYVEMSRPTGAGGIDLWVAARPF
jgi:hypothetical protein